MDLRRRPVPVDQGKSSEILETLYDVAGGGSVASLQYIASRSRAKGRVSRGSKFRSWHLRPAMLRQPPRPILPPRALEPFPPVEPLQGVYSRFNVRYPVAPTRFLGRSIDNSRYVPFTRQRKANGAINEVTDSQGLGPGGNVILNAAYKIERLRYVAQIQAAAVHLNSLWRNQSVVNIKFPQVER